MNAIFVGHADLKAFRTGHGHLELPLPCGPGHRLKLPVPFHRQLFQVRLRCLQVALSLEKGLGVLGYHVLQLNVILAEPGRRTGKEEYGRSNGPASPLQDHRDSWPGRHGDRRGKRRDLKPDPGKRLLGSGREQSLLALGTVQGGLAGGAIADMIEKRLTLRLVEQGVQVVQQLTLIFLAVVHGFLHPTLS